ncbi:MAG: glutaredoxin domain-containing protein [Candidatus Micrarchaeota archaeon]
MQKVIIYGTAWCPWCVRAKNFMEQNSIPFEWKDADQQENADEAFRKSRQTGIPVLDMEGTILVGFDVERVRKLLETKK